MVAPKHRLKRRSEYWDCGAKPINAAIAANAKK